MKIKSNTKIADRSIRNESSERWVIGQLYMYTARVTSCPGLPGTVPEWNKMSRVPASSIPGQWNVPDWIYLELNSPIFAVLFLTNQKVKIYLQ